MPLLLERIGQFAASIPAELKSQGRDAHSLEYVVAERKAFLSKKKLVYRARFRIDESTRTLHFTEYLKESGFGLTSGGDDVESGFGFKKETYKIGSSGREGSIEEQWRLFGKSYSFTFDYGAIRNSFKAIAAEYGYDFQYHILGLG